MSDSSKKFAAFSTGFPGPILQTFIGSHSVLRLLPAVVAGGVCIIVGLMIRSRLASIELALAEHEYRSDVRHHEGQHSEIC